MTRNILLSGLVGIIIGSFVTYKYVSTQESTYEKEPKQLNTTQQYPGSDQRKKTHSEQSMDEMVQSLEGKKGDEFDKIFLEHMIAHHVGAVQMAHEAATRAKHNELRDMAQDIISSQTKEVTQMNRWMEMWGYNTIRH